ncbi:MAG: glycosyltransferase family 2 protein [Proteobacteria bacterium]|nr:glycosyltransferase family 2 protein [Pseudomonadota bacterium]
MQGNNKTIEVTILLPAYNEELSLGETIQKLKSLYPDFEILVVDDGSTDHTMQVAMDAGANVWPHPYTMGKGAAVKTGLRCAKGQWVLMMDADSEYNPDDISRLLEFKDNYDMIVGARSNLSSKPLHLGIANKIYNRFASYITKFNIQDLTSGFRIVKIKTARQFIYLLPNTFLYSSTLTLAYLRSGRSVKYVPVETMVGKEKDTIRLLPNSLRFFLTIVQTATIFSPLRIFLPISGVLFLTGLFYYLYTFIAYARFTNMSALLFNTSIIILMMGLISEQITQMRYDKVE